MKYEHFLAQFFNHFIQTSPPKIAKLKMVPSLWPSWLAPHLITSKTHPKLYALPSPINMITMIRQNTKFPPTARSSRKT